MKINDIKINNQPQQAGAAPLENKTGKAQTANDSYKASTKDPYSRLTSGKAMFENMSAPETTSSNNNTHGGDVNATLGSIGDGTYNTAETQASDAFAPPAFADILEKLDKNAYDVKSIEAVLAKYDAKIDEYLSALKNLESSSTLGAQVICNTLKSKMALWDIERDKVEQHLIDCKNIDKKEMSVRKDLNGDGKVWKWREVETVYGTKVLIDDQNRIISNNNFTYGDGNSDMGDYNPKLTGGDLNYIRKDDNGRFIFSMEALVEKWNKGQEGQLELNIPPSVWVRVDGDGEIVMKNNTCSPLGMQSDGTQGGDKANYVLIPVTDVEIITKNVKGQPEHVTDTIIRIKGNVPGEKGIGAATLLEMSIQPAMANDGTLISAAGTPIKLDIAGDVKKWKGPPQVINVDAGGFTPQTYTKIPNSMLAGANSIDKEKLGLLTGDISGKKYLFKEDEDEKSLKEEDFKISVDGNSPCIMAIGSDMPLRDNGSGRLTTGLVINDRAAGKRILGSGNDLIIAEDFSSICEYNEDAPPPNPGDPQFSRVYDGGYGENMIVGNASGDIKDISFGTLAAKSFTLVDIRNTATDDLIYASSPDIDNGRNFQRRWNVQGECQFFAGAEEEYFAKYDGYEALSNDEWAKKGDKVNVSGGVRMQGGANDKGVLDVDTNNRSVDNEVVDAMLDIFDSYSNILNPDDILQNNEVTTAEESAELWKQYEAELDSFFSLVNQSGLESYV